MKALMAYGLALVGLGMTILAVVKAMAFSARYAIMKPMLLHMLRTQPQRAQLLCRTNPKTFMEAVGTAMQTAAMTQSQDPAILLKSTRPAYDGTSLGIGIHWKMMASGGVRGAAAALGSIALAAGMGSSPVLGIICTVLAASGVAWLYSRKLEVDRSLVLARAEILPEVDRVFIDGRFGA